MTPVKERAKHLIDLLPEDAVRALLEDLEDALDLEQAIATSDPAQAIELREFLRQLRAEGHPDSVSPARGDWRIFYLVHDQAHEVRVYRIKHRFKAY